jgi:hypothetical protein
MANWFTRVMGFPDREMVTNAPAPVPTNGAHPRKATVGTSYTTKGMPGVAPPPLDEEGGSSQPTRIIEQVPDLLPGYPRLVTYNAMMNDAGVDVSIRAAKTPVLAAEFFVEAYSDDPQDQEISEFVWANIAEGMNAPFLNSLEDILQFYVDGYSVLEKVYELREWSPKRKASNTRQYTMLKKLGYRPASTIQKIEYDDNGGPLDVIQNAIQADNSIVEETLDISKIIIFTFARRGGDLTGRSLLRTAYPHWYYKTHLYKIDAIQKERNSLGIPKGMLKPGYTQNDKTILRQMLRNLRTNEESFMVLTPNIDVEFAEVKSQLVNVMESADHHNMMILMNVLGQFLALGIGPGSGGGRATGATQSDLFMKSLRYVANYIADCVNMYLIPELVVWNYPTTNFPRLRVRNVGETKDIQMLAAGLANLSAQGLITNDFDTEQWVRRVFDMPAKQVIPATEQGEAGVDDTTIQPTGQEPTNIPQTTPTPPTQNGSSGNSGKGSVPSRIRPGNTGKPPNSPN